jgi:hypothetical protein
MSERERRSENIFRMFGIFGIEDGRMVIEDKARGDFYIEADHEPSRYVLIMQGTGTKKDFTFCMFDHIEDAMNYATDELESHLGGGSYPVIVPRIAVQLCDLDHGTFTDLSWRARATVTRSMGDWE